MRHSPRPFDGHKVALLRDAMGYTATDLARIVGIHHGHMRRLELGERHPSPMIRNRIAAALGVGIDDLAPDPVPSTA
jgi:transcriptional regulator with XRE-family HTH domain